MTPRAREKWTLAGIAVALLLVGLTATFSVFTMPDASMQPAVADAAGPTLNKGDVVLALRWFQRSSLRVGDLVCVDVVSNDIPVRVVRKVERIEVPAPVPVRAGGSVGSLASRR